ncbi:hypothetical protein OG883_14670 [Streptomyces sp. NBC_01142]|uniref:hypothetical protein n=1 Tax=Streptomyces sp. NBC_01142 TaxID=2975865 RepID=UPI0022587E75|nr:hypothetical protein [Streptomyces sp. NBC_01142]MCX4821135.1 hypothetical protein [Streptomyces sp. NBC_01142]
MQQRVRLLVSATLPSLLIGVWAAFLLLTGATPSAAAGGQVAAPVASARLDGPQRTAQSRPEVRRATASASVAVLEIVAAESSPRPPDAPPAPAGPVPPAYQPPVHGGETAQPRQERAPPGDPYDPRRTRAPPSTRSS